MILLMHFKPFKILHRDEKPFLKKIDRDNCILQKHMKIHTFHPMISNITAWRSFYFICVYVCFSVKYTYVH